MDYELLLELNEYALILRGKTNQEYAVVYELDKESGHWSWTCSYWMFSDEKEKAIALSRALEFFMLRTKCLQVSRGREEELLDMFATHIMENEDAWGEEFFDDECELTPEEKEYFGLDCIKVIDVVDEIDDFDLEDYDVDEEEL